MRPKTVATCGFVENVDLLRCIAILCVILCHAITAVYDIDLESMTPIRPTVVLAFTLFTIGRTGVPIFLMVTGYLLLDRPYDEGGAVRFWKRNLLVERLAGRAVCVGCPGRVGGLMDSPCCSFRRPVPFRPCAIVSCVCAARAGGDRDE